MNIDSIPILVAAADYSLIYLLGGGGVFGAIVIFFLAKVLGK
jgi:predicted tellurium resistance membrane protein TerC